MADLKNGDKIDQYYDDMFGKNGHPDLKELENKAMEQAPYERELAAIEKNYDKNADSSLETKNIQTAKKINYTPSTSKSKISLQRRLKKFGPLGGLIGILGGGIFGLGVMFSPSISIMHLAEALAGDLSDAVPAMDSRSVKVLRAKLDKMGPRFGSCGLIKIRCQLRGMSEKQIENFKKAGIDVEVGEDTGFGKKQIKSLSLPVSDVDNCKDCVDGKLKVTDPSMLRKYIGDSGIRNQLRRAYNPKFYMMRDKLAATRLGRLHTSLADKLKGTDADSINKEIDAATAGEKVQADVEKISSSENDSDTTKQDSERRNGVASEYASSLNEVDAGPDSVFTNASKGVVKGAMKGVGLLGGVDSACSFYNGSRATSALAKAKKSIQLAQYAMIFLTFANQLKAAGEVGDSGKLATQAALIGAILTAVDTRKEIYNENSKTSDGQLQKVANPDFGKGVFDAQAIKAALHNDAPVPSARTISFSVGGGLTGTLDEVNKKAASIILPGGGTPSELTARCKVVQNGFVRLGSLVVGIAVGIGTLGWSTALSIGGSVAISLAMPLIQSYLAGIITGKLVSSKLANVDAGNAIFAGSAVILGSMAMSRGMKPATKSDLKTYMAFSQTVKDEYVAMETEDAKNTPFDITNQYSFLGSFARKLTPANVSLGSLNPLKFVGALSNEVIPKASALSSYNEARYSRCSDYGYQALGIDADVMCNVRYTMSPAELSMDTDEVIQKMYDGKYIDEEGAAQGEYSEWLTECVDREQGWGETLEEGNKGDGERCMDTSEKSSIFRVYTMDQTITEGMDNGPVTGDLANSDTTSGAGFTVAAYNVLRSNDVEHVPTACRYLGEPVGPKCEEARIQLQADIFNGKTSLGNPAFDLVLINETIEPDHKKRVQKLPEFDSVMNDEFSIFWRKDVFTKTEEGKVKSWSGSGRYLDAPWVKLVTKSGNKTVYALPVHYSSFEQFGGSAEKSQEAARLTLDFIKPRAEQEPDAIVLAGGDTGKYHRKASAVFNASGVVENVGLMAQGKKSTGDNDAVGADQMYVTPIKDLVATDYNRPGEAPGSIVSKASDHAPVYAKISVGGATSNTSYKNPIATNNIPDPSGVENNNGGLSVYASGFQVYNSQGLGSWKKNTSGVFTGSDPFGSGADHWAPEVTKTADHYTIVYSGGTPKKIGYGVSDKPGGPFKDKGMLIGQMYGTGYTIDPNLVNISGNQYVLYFGSDAAHGISGQKMELNGDTLKPVGSPKIVLTGEAGEWTTEAPSVIYKNNKYYMFFSTGNYVYRSDYRVRVAASDNPMGPFVRKPGDNRVLVSSSVFAGPGGQSIFTDSAGQEWLLYHARRPSGSMDRMLMIDKIDFSGAWPKISDGQPSTTKQNGPKLSGVSK